MITIRWADRVAGSLERKVSHIICRINANKCLECLVLAFLYKSGKNFLQQELIVPSCAAAIAQDILYQGFILFISPCAECSRLYYYDILSIKFGPYTVSYAIL